MKKQPLTEKQRRQRYRPRLIQDHAIVEQWRERIERDDRPAPRVSNCKAMHGSACYFECTSSFDCKASTPAHFINPPGLKRPSKNSSDQKI